MVILTILLISIYFSFLTSNATIPCLYVKHDRNWNITELSVNGKEFLYAQGYIEQSTIYVDYHHSVAKVLTELPCSLIIPTRSEKCTAQIEGVITFIGRTARLSRERAFCKINCSPRKRVKRDVSSDPNKYSLRPALKIYPNNLPLNPVKTIHRPSNKSEPYILELYLAVDVNYMRRFNFNYDKVTNNINAVMKIVQSYYTEFNINIVVVQLELGVESEKINRLEYMRRYKTTEVNIRNDCMHFILANPIGPTNEKLTEGTMCQNSRCVEYTVIVRDEDRYMSAMKIAYKLARNFGLRPDNDDCACNSCLMSNSETYADHWSECSLRDMESALKTGFSSCLRDAPSPSRSIIIERRDMFDNYERYHKRHTNPSNILFDQPEKEVMELMPKNREIESLCGNGILDPNEDCDCGLERTCPPEVEACCNPITCKFRQGAECAGGPCCEINILESYKKPDDRIGFLATCKLKKAGSVCREEGNDCDLAEYCDGVSEWCPADVHKADGIKCYTEDGYRAYCAYGGCRTAETWCKALWGSTARKAPAECFKKNQNSYEGLSKVSEQRGHSIANCGKEDSQLEQRQEISKRPGIKCPTKADLECGRLWCVHSNEKPILNGFVATMEHETHYETCHALLYDPNWPAIDTALVKSAYKSLIYNPIYFVSDMKYAGASGANPYVTTYQDAGMVPDGTPCSKGMCYGGRCQTIEEVKAPMKAFCNCENYGVCNNRGNCHCYSGFGGIRCAETGTGGSPDSGPTPEYSSSFKLTIAFVIFFLVILPIFIFIMYFILCRRVDGKFQFVKQWNSSGTALIGCFDESCYKNLFRKGKNTEFGKVPLFAYNCTNKPQVEDFKHKINNNPEYKSLSDQRKLLERELQSIISKKPDYLREIDAQWEKQRDTPQKPRKASNVKSTSIQPTRKAPVPPKPKTSLTPAPVPPINDTQYISPPVIQSSTYKNRLVDRECVLSNLREPEEL